MISSPTVAAVGNVIIVVVIVISGSRFSYCPFLNSKVLLPKSLRNPHLRVSDT